jgi:choline-sulfatase
VRTFSLRRCAGAFSCVLFACAPDPVERPDILLVVIDTLRADHVGSYGYSRPTTPNLDRLATEGALFEVAYSPMGTTTPAHAALFTAREPLSLGVVRNGLILGEESLTLAELLAGAGYQTAAFVSSYPVSRRFGLAQGFAHFDDTFHKADSKVRMQEWEDLTVDGGFDRNGQATVDAALAWLETEATASPLFLWLHLFDPHGPHRPNDAAKKFAPQFIRPGMTPQQQRIALYDANVRYADEQLGRIVQYLSESRDWDNTLCVVLSDHGEGLRDHRWSFHNRYTYEEELRVPLVVRWPGRVAAALRVVQPAHLVDLLPTLSSALGLETEEHVFHGIDLMPHLLQTGEHDAERALFLQRPYYENGQRGFGDEGPGFGLRKGAWKYFEAPEEGRRELYDLDADPRERVDLSSDRREQADAMSALIAAWREQREAPAAAAADLSPEDRAAMKALGYAE